MDTMDSVVEYLWSQVKALKPSFVSKKPHFSFISVHYFIIIGFAILGSILIYATGRGNITYIDALFFASGANTQAGLNTVNVNDINTFQQLVLFFFAMTSNPITINSCVVFLRIYWFEKRFQHVVREARLRRGTISKSKSKSKARVDPGQLERGVNGRNITVMHGGQKSRITNDGILLDDHDQSDRSSELENQEQNGNEEDKKKDGNANGHVPEPNGKERQRPEAEEEEGGDDDDGNHSPSSIPADTQENRRPEIKFADTVKRSDGVEDDTKLPQTRSEEEHIAILERQRNPGNDDILRIPGPRDIERGVRPTRVEEGDDAASEPTSAGARGRQSIDSAAASQSRGIEGRHQAIAIQEPERRAKYEVEDDAIAAARVFTPLRLRKPRILNRSLQKHHEKGDALHRTNPSIMRRRPTFDSIRTALSRDKEDQMTPYLSWEPTLGRNSSFPGLTVEQRDELGGIEYRSLKTLALILTCYFWGFGALGVVCLVPWIIKTNVYGTIVDNAGQNRTWWGFFTTNSAFLDVGFTLTPNSMNSFNTAIFPLLLMSFLIVIGNTGFPVMLRFVIWVLSVFAPRGSGIWEELRFLLDHPRRCFTLLFPSGATWWLFWLLVILNGVDLILFIILDLGSGPIAQIPAGTRVLDGLFQAFSTRTAGFTCVNLAYLHPAVQTSYLIMMYISVFPIAISVRRTNVYEEKSLGIYHKGGLHEEQSASDLSYVGAHLRRQLSFDVWYIFLGFFILTISEGGRLQSGSIQMFAVLFEVVSAYGTVGLSLGYPTTDASLSSQFTVVGKLVIIAMMIRGRHRGLPYGLDRAILLPSESLNQKEGEDADARPARRRNSAASPGRQPARSRSTDRGNAHLLTQFLHPGPVGPSDPPRDPLRRAASCPGVQENGEPRPSLMTHRTIPRTRCSEDTWR